MTKLGAGWYGPLELVLNFVVLSAAEIQGNLEPRVSIGVWIP